MQSSLGSFCVAKGTGVVHSATFVSKASEGAVELPFVSGLTLFRALAPAFFLPELLVFLPAFLPDLLSACPSFSSTHGTKSTVRMLSSISEDQMPSLSGVDISIGSPLSVLLPVLFAFPVPGFAPGLRQIFPSCLKSAKTATIAVDRQEDPSFNKVVQEEKLRPGKHPQPCHAVRVEGLATTFMHGTKNLTSSK